MPQKRIQLYRITRKPYADDLTGTGAMMYGGRWNLEGVRALYTSTHRSLALLELLVNSDLTHIPPDLVILEIEVSGRVDEYLDKEDLPFNWSHYPSPPETKQFGSEWLKESGKYLLSVPSVILPEERNIVVNPLHKDHASAKIVAKRNLLIDSRFF